MGQEFKSTDSAQPDSNSYFALTISFFFEILEQFSFLNDEIHVANVKNYSLTNHIGVLVIKM